MPGKEGPSTGKVGLEWTQHPLLVPKKTETLIPCKTSISGLVPERGLRDL